MHYQLHLGDCRASMRKMAPRSVQTCVTSPPYFGLRDYGHPGQIGLEQTPDAYVAAMVEVFRCVRDVLADDGTLWLNIGDSYAGVGGRSEQSGQMAGRAHGKAARSARFAGGDAKHKDLIGIPWLLAFALRADGWYLRQDIIWHKPNPMPESVRDRCTKAHEYLFLLSKSDRYYFDSEAMKEPAVSSAPSGRPYLDQTEGNVLGRAKTPQSGLKDREPSETRNRRSVWTVATRPYKGAHFATYPPALIEPCILAGSRPGDIVLDPFGGSGTTAQVALEHGRRAVLCELNPAYEALIAERIFGDIA